MSTLVDPDAIRVARRVARALIRDGARAVVLTGSYARGEAHVESDIDLIAIVGSTAGVQFKTIQRAEPFLVTVASATAAGVRRSFRDPALVGTNVPGWRDAIVLADPDGVAARLQKAARRWSWEAIDTACERWVAENVAGYAEEVHKLVGALAAGDNELAAVQRSILALHLAKVAAVNHRTLFGSENVMWRMAAERMGHRWAKAQARALSLHGESVAVSSRAALEMYCLLSAETSQLLDRDQRSVVRHAREIASGR